jgi:excisionase family DNA binding protein
MSIHDADWMTVPEVAVALGVHPETVRGWIRHGHLSADRRKRTSGRGVVCLWVRRTDVRAFAGRNHIDRGRPARPETSPGKILVLESTGDPTTTSMN